MLQRVLKANEAIIFQATPVKEVAEELLAARNLMVLRSLVMLVSGCTDKGESGPLYCSYLTGMIRLLVAKERGLVASLLKQGIPDKAVDFLIDNVPECFGDAYSLAMLLSDRSPLAAAERLMIADGALRIAIVHGTRNESEAKNLAAAALSTLLSTFFLVVGPVGVPVVTLVGEDAADVTQKCRHAATRMLETLQRVRANRPGIRNECTSALQKLCGLCKGEAAMSGVAGAVASRRKKVLKDIYDNAVKALNGMASGVQI
jgi:hypothetical protein